MYFKPMGLNKDTGL